MSVRRVTVGDFLRSMRGVQPHRDEELEEHLAVLEIAERLVLKDEEGEEPFWSGMSRRQLVNEARRVHAVQKRWAEAQRRDT